MKIVEAELKVPRYVSVRAIDVERDSLYRDVATQSKKVVSHTRGLDEDVIDRIKDYNIRKIWVKRSCRVWVTSYAAGERDLSMNETRKVEVEKGKTIKHLSKLRTAPELKSFLKKFAGREIPPHRRKKAAELAMDADDLTEHVREFRQRLGEESDEQKRLELGELLKQQPENAKPVDFPQGYRRGFARKYMSYLGDLLELRFQAQQLVLKTETELLTELSE